MVTGLLVVVAAELSVACAVSVRLALAPVDWAGVWVSEADVSCGRDKVEVS
jgi:hypothetical protein